MEAFPDSERRQERRFNWKGVVMNLHHVHVCTFEEKKRKKYFGCFYFYFFNK